MTCGTGQLHRLLRVTWSGASTQWVALESLNPARPYPLLRVLGVQRCRTFGLAGRGSGGFSGCCQAGAPPSLGCDLDVCAQVSLHWGVSACREQ